MACARRNIGRGISTQPRPRIFARLARHLRGRRLLMCVGCRCRRGRRSSHFGCDPRNRARSHDGRSGRDDFDTESTCELITPLARGKSFASQSLDQTRRSRHVCAQARHSQMTSGASRLRLVAILTCRSPHSGQHGTAAQTLVCPFVQPCDGLASTFVTRGRTGCEAWVNPSIHALTSHPRIRPASRHRRRQELGARLVGQSLPSPLRRRSCPSHASRLANRWRQA